MEGFTPQSWIKCKSNDTIGLVYQHKTLSEAELKENIFNESSMKSHVCGIMI